MCPLPVVETPEQVLLLSERLETTLNEIFLKIGKKIRQPIKNFSSPRIDHEIPKIVL